MTQGDLDAWFKGFAPVPVVAILRGVPKAQVLAVCETLLSRGIRFMEITMNTRDALESMALVSANLKDVRLGAGTVTSPDEVEAVSQAGGTYIISPNVDVAVIRKTKALGLISIPGFLTPTEAFMAASAGADILKCFPVGRMGPGYLKDLRAVLDKPLLAVGGVDGENLPDYMMAGAVGVGMGSNLYHPQVTLPELGERAKFLVDACMKLPRTGNQ